METPKDKESVLALYMEGPALLERAIAGLQEVDLDVPPSPGGWTIRQIVHHVVDGDDVWKMCIKMALGNENAEFTLPWYWALSQDVWADRWCYAGRPLGASLDLLKANRNHVKQLLEHAPDGWNRSVDFRKSDGQTERIPVGAVVKINADHVVHHVNRILAIRGKVNGGGQSLGR